MKHRWSKAISLALFLWVVVALQACGHGGTEVGNPPGPQIPGAGGGPGFEDDSEPTPSPGANLRFDELEDEKEIALTPEETES